MNTRSDKNQEIITLFKNWARYPKIEKIDQQYIFYFEDPYFKKVPMRVFVPGSYNEQTKTPLLLLLHGSVESSSFESLHNSSNTVSQKTASKDIFFDYFKKQDYIILCPIADPKKNFNWVRNSFPNNEIQTASYQGLNLTFNCIYEVIIQLKRTFNLDDNKIYAFGHSDGADGAFALGLFKPDIFACFLVYNSLLNNIREKNIYLKNTQNRPFYIVHSDFDKLRPIEQTQTIVEKLTTISYLITYKECKGYSHFDKHLKLDLPLANRFILKNPRNPFPASVYWESNNAIYNHCDWIQVLKFNFWQKKQKWHNKMKIGTYNKSSSQWEKKAISNPRRVMQ